MQPPALQLRVLAGDGVDQVLALRIRTERPALRRQPVPGVDLVTIAHQMTIDGAHCDGRGVAGCGSLARQLVPTPAGTTPRCRGDGHQTVTVSCRALLAITTAGWTSQPEHPSLLPASAPVTASATVQPLSGPGTVPLHPDPGCAGSASPSRRTLPGRGELAQPHQ